MHYIAFKRFHILDHIVPVLGGWIISDRIILSASRHGFGIRVRWFVGKCGLALLFSQTIEAARVLEGPRGGSNACKAGLITKDVIARVSQTEKHE